MSRPTSRPWWPVLVLAALLVAAAVGVRALEGPRPLTVTATFERTVGLYPGDDVRVVGVPVGTITAIDPLGDRVEVTMELDPGTDVAAGTGAVIVPPGVLASRYVQLTEPWLEGPRLGDGDRIDAKRTAAPLELDDVTAQLDDFLAALGPRGDRSSITADGGRGTRVGGGGALADLLVTADTALAGNGTTLRETLADVADALDTVGAGKADIVTTVEQLQTFVSALSTGDAGIRALERDLGLFTTTLADQRTGLRSTIRNIAVTVRVVQRFLRTNRGALTADVRLLRRLTTTLVDRERELTEIADLGPLGIEGIFGAANLETGVLDARVDLTPLLVHADTTLCELLEGAALGDLCPSQVPPPPTGEEH